MDPIGTHRIKNPDPKEDGVWVTDGTTSQEITEDAYLSNGYKPKLSALPWGSAAPLPNERTEEPGIQPPRTAND